MGTTTQRPPLQPSTLQAQAPTRSLADLRAPGTPPSAPPLPRRPSPPGPVAPEASMPAIGVGFGNLQAFEFGQRVARALASSSLVPETYRLLVPKGKFGNARNEMVENPSAIANCMIALNIADRLKADPLMVMQHLHIIEGRPSWSSQFVIAMINQSSRFTPLQFRVNKGAEPVTMTYEVMVWDEGVRDKVPSKRTASFKPISVVAWAKDRATGELLESPEITMEMAVLEGWFGRSGSKWQTMPEMMARYRAASFFGRLYAPELLMGLRTEEETREVIDAEYDTTTSGWAMPQAEEGRVEPDIGDLQGHAEEVTQQDAPLPEAAPQQAEEAPAAQQQEAPPEPARTRKSPAKPAVAEAPPAEEETPAQPAGDPPAEPRFTAAGEAVKGVLASTKAWLVREIKLPEGTTYGWRDADRQCWVSPTMEEAEAAMRAQRDADDFPGTATPR